LSREDIPKPLDTIEAEKFSSSLGRFQELETYAYSFIDSLFFNEFETFTLQKVHKRNFIKRLATL
jgi:hypothetical protein